MSAPRPAEAFRPTKPLFRFVLGGIVAATAPLAVLWALDLAQFDNIFAEVVSAVWLGCALSVFAFHFRDGLDTALAIHRMTIVIVAFPILASVDVLALFLVGAAWDAAGGVLRNDAVAVALVASIVGGALLTSVAISFRATHPRWIWLTRLGAVAGFAVFAVIVARPVVNAVAILTDSTAAPFGALEEDLLWRFQYRLLTPTYGDGCTTLIAFLPAIGLAALRLGRANRRRQAGAMACGLALGLSWMLFGFEATALSGTQHSILRREFGRATVLHLISAGREVSRSTWAWSRPFTLGCMPISACVTRPAETRADSNGDGAWDVWTRRLDLPDPTDWSDCSLAYSVDTTGDGKPDWSFVSAIEEEEQMRKKIVECRGY